MLLVDLHIKDVSAMENWKELIFFMTSSVTANMSMYKSFLFDSASMKNLIKEAFLHDSSVQLANSKLKKELEEHGNVCRNFLMFYIICFICIVFSFYAGGIILYVMSLKCDPNLEECSRNMAWPSVSILNVETHYGICLILNSFGG